MPAAWWTTGRMSASSVSPAASSSWSPSPVSSSRTAVAACPYTLSRPADSLDSGPAVRR